MRTCLANPDTERSRRNAFSNMETAQAWTRNTCYGKVHKASCVLSCYIAPLWNNYVTTM